MPSRAFRGRPGASLRGLHDAFGASIRGATMDSFRINFAQTDLDDLRRRLDNVRWPADPGGAGWERGVPLDYLRELTDYWRDGYRWREAEAELNRHPQFVT